MSQLSEKVAHLRGLLEGLNLDEKGKESKVFTAIADVLENIAEELDLLERKHEELDDFVDAIDGDLSDLEEAVYDDDDDMDDDDEDDDVVNYVCPHCGEEIPLDTDLIALGENLACPNCGKPLFPEDDGDEDDEGENE